MSNQTDKERPGTGQIWHTLTEQTGSAIAPFNGLILLISVTSRAVLRR